MPPIEDCRLRRYAPLRFLVVAEAEPQELALNWSSHRTLGLVYLELEPSRKEARDVRHHPLSRSLAADVDIAVSSPGELHPEALAELYVSLSTHTAPIMEPAAPPSASGRTTPERVARCGRSSVPLCGDGGAASCISAWPRGPNLGPARASSGKAPSDNIARNIGASPG